MRKNYKCFFSLCRQRAPHNMQPPVQQSGPGPIFPNNGPGPGQQQQMFSNMPQGMNLTIHTKVDQ